MQQVFLPALGPYITDSPKEVPIRFPYHWLDPKSPIYYPWGLASYALWRDAELPKGTSREGPWYFGDSGGYTQVTQPKYSASPTDVIRWQIANCKRGVMFDIPPYRPGSAIQFSGSAAEHFDESLDLSIRNVQRALPYYQDCRKAFKPEFGFRWWGVIQGEEREQMERWWGGISENYPFTDRDEGWALAPKPSTDLLSCTRYMKFAHDKGIRNVHLLQVTAESTVALVLSLGLLSGNFDLVTYDSASALRCAIYRSAIMQNGWGQEYIKESRNVEVDEFCPACNLRGTECQCPGNDNTLHHMMMTCQCQACEWYREYYPLTNAEYPHIILLHNHIAMVSSFAETWTEAQRDPDRMIRWATGKQYGDVLREWEGQGKPKTQRKRRSLFDRIAEVPYEVNQDAGEGVRDPAEGERNGDGDLQPALDDGRRDSEGDRDQAGPHLAESLEAGPDQNVHPSEEALS